MKLAGKKTLGGFKIPECQDKTDLIGRCAQRFEEAVETVRDGKESLPLSIGQDGRRVKSDVFLGTEKG